MFSDLFHMRFNSLFFDEKNCEWVVGEHLCDQLYRGHVIGREYCQWSCGYCEDDWYTDDGHHCDKHDDEHFRYGGKYWKVSAFD